MYLMDYNSIGTIFKMNRNTIPKGYKMAVQLWFGDQFHAKDL